MLQDLRFAVRSLSRRPGFLATAVLTCGLGVGASATLFSVVDGVLLRPFPYRASDRIAILWHEFGHGVTLRPIRVPKLDTDYFETWPSGLPCGFQARRSAPRERGLEVVPVPL